MISADSLSTTVLKYQAAVPLFEIAWIYTSNLSFIVIPQLKYVFRLDENVSRATGQNSENPYGNSNLNFRLARDHVMHLETEANLCVSRHHENHFSQLFLFFS